MQIAICSDWAWSDRKQLTVLQYCRAGAQRPGRTNISDYDVQAYMSVTRPFKPEAGGAIVRWPAVSHRRRQC